MRSLSSLATRAFSFSLSFFLTEEIKNSSRLRLTARLLCALSNQKQKSRADFSASLTYEGAKLTPHIQKGQVLNRTKLKLCLNLLFLTYTADVQITCWKWLFRAEKWWHISCAHSSIAVCFLIQWGNTQSSFAFLVFKPLLFLHILLQKSIRFWWRVGGFKRGPWSHGDCSGFTPPPGIST